MAASSAEAQRGSGRPGLVVRMRSGGQLSAALHQESRERLTEVHGRLIKEILV